MSYLEQYLSEAQSLGVTKPLKPALAAREHAERLGAALDAHRAAGERERAQLVDDIAAQRRAPEDALTVDRTWAHGSPASEVIVAAVAVAHRLADEMAVRAVPEVFGELVALVERTVAASVDTAAGLHSTAVDEHTALVAEQGSQWRRLDALHGTWERAAGLYRIMQRLGGGLDGPQPVEHMHGHGISPPTAWQWYRYPERLGPSWEATPRELKLAVAYRLGAEPGLYPWADARARMFASVGGANHPPSVAALMTKVNVYERTPSGTTRADADAGRALSTKIERRS